MKKKIKRTKKLKIKISHTKGRTKKAIKADLKRKAKHPGKRKSKSGNFYYESRPNRSDIKGTRL